MAKNAASGIEIEEDRRHQRRGWHMERVGWIVISLLLLASLLGLLGDGPASRAQAGEPGSLLLRYERYQRASAPTQYRFDAAPALARDGRLVLRFDQGLLEEIELKSIVPEPETVRTGPGYTEFEFAMAPGEGRAGRIVFQFNPSTFGRVRGRITAPGAPPLTVDQIVLP